MYTAPSEIRTGHWFCGAGGDTIGIADIPGTVVRVAANHDPDSIATHEENFPDALHKLGDIRKLDLRGMPPVELFVATPECPAWGHAQGVEQTFAKQATLFELGDDDDPDDGSAGRSRALVWNVLHYLDAMRLRGHTVLAGFMENVPDICKWMHFQAFRNEFHKRGYKTRVIALNSMHAHGPRSPLAPQSRDRFYLAFWHEKLGRDPNWDKWLRPLAWCESCEEQVAAMQVFKKPGGFMGNYRQQYVYRCPKVSCRGHLVEPGALPAMAVLDLDNPGTRLGDKKHRQFKNKKTGEVTWGPLAPKTMARLEAGLIRHAQPITLAVAGHTFERHPGVRTWPVSDPLTTQTTTASTAMACPPLLVPSGGTWNDTATPATDPMRTRTTRECEGVAFPPFMVPLRSGRNRSMAITGQMATIVTNGGGHILAVPGGAMVMRNNLGMAEMCTPVDEALRTLTTKGHQSLVTWPAKILVPYNGTGVARSITDPMGALPTHDRYALATGQLPFDLDEVWYRMLTVPEIHMGMAFRPDYVILGKNNAVKIRQLGNAVTPPAAEVIGSALVEAITGESLLTRWEIAA
jgi:DNA (cytosine-5)-methyltransferase 1